MSKDQVSRMDPRDQSGPRTRRTMDERGTHVFRPHPINATDALMRCAPGQEPAEYETNERLASDIEMSMMSLTLIERQCWESQPTPVREVALWLGVSKSAVQRARLSAKDKLAEALKDWV